MKIFLRNIVVVVCLFTSFEALAQKGGIRGTVMDLDFEVPLPGVKVVISETGQEVVTGDTGSFYLEQIEPGSYTVMFSKAGYTRMTKPNIVVSPGQLSEVEASLAGEYEEMDELVVKEISLGGASEIGLLNLRMESSALMDSVGADLISQAGASDAAGALKLVSGTTVQDGKYAVVRGLPDRYVVSTLNGVRLPTADPDKRAVQLDQYPSSLIESVRVLKSFTPDQQGDASGGSVDVVLRGIPEERLLKFSVGTKFYSNTADDGEFLTYEQSEMEYLGKRDFNPPPDAGDAANPAPQTVEGSYGTKTTDQPDNFSWAIDAGDRINFDVFGEDVSLGGLATFSYEQKAYHRDGVISDKYYENDTAVAYLGLEPGQLAPYSDGLYQNGILQVDELVLTDLYDITKSTHEINWSGALAVGLEHELLKLNYLHVFTHNAEDSAVVSTDTRGRELYNPQYLDYVDGSDQSINVAPYRITEAMLYKERDTHSDQFGGELTIPIPELGEDGIFQFKRPVFDWKLSQSSSSLQEQKEINAYTWIPGAVISSADPEYDWTIGIPPPGTYPIDTLGNFAPGAAWTSAFTNSNGEVYTPPAVSAQFRADYDAFRRYIEANPQLGLVFPDFAWFNEDIYDLGAVPETITGVESNGTYFADEPQEQLGNRQMIWQEVVEDSDQVAFNYKWDFANWTENEGYFKAGFFQDRVDRKYFQQSLSNKERGVSIPTIDAPWDVGLAELFPANSPTEMYAYFGDVQYTGDQDIDAYYLMTDFPVFDFLSVRGGARYEEFTLKTFLDPDDDSVARQILPDNGALAFLNPKPGGGYEEDANYNRSDVLPSVGFDLTPIENVMFRFNWAQTIAKQQFKEVVPIIQREYAGAPAFYGNPNLVASPVENYDFRLDYTPYPGGLLSASFFTKDIEDPIQYYESSDGNGQKYTFVQNYPSAWVRGYELEARQSLGQFLDPLEGFGVGANFTLIEGEVDLGDGTTSDVQEMPEYLANLFCTYDIDFMDTKFGLFYTHQGDTLKRVKNTTGGSPSPAVYALPYGVLNFTVSTKITDHFKLSFKAKNLTDPDIQTVYREEGYKDALRSSYTKGREYSIGLSAEW